MKPLLISVALLVLTVGFTGCGANAHNCTPGPGTVTITPASANADHTLPAPGNQVQFTATESGFALPSGCSQAQLIWAQKWTDSDPADVTIDQAGPTNGLATCVNATAGAVTVTGTGYSPGGRSHTGTAQLTCK